MPPGDRLPKDPAGAGLKRAIDLLGAAAGLAVLSPLIGATALALWIAQGRPILFRQSRPGLRERPFTLVKFRTMRPLLPGEPPYVSDAARLTPIGRFLRSTSIDELPEFWNVLRGEMSLVGPRPLLFEYLGAYTPEERRRHDVLPGVTGWAAVNGRHAISFRERLALDVWYVDHRSTWLDLRILARTVAQVLRRADVVAAQSPEAVGAPLPPPGATDGARRGGASARPGES
jgi:lipopolysaccharide/colanic/teichoic acid biosynthesis glycosyltransferase